ncbi:MAG: hypothetical protein K9M82_10425, partial [Deltaproteobacteria bacterium]|nr:hypothetical protein [Deltaproteobacteria bacterium]
MILFILMGVCLLAAGCLAAIGGAAIRRDPSIPDEDPAAFWPDVGMVVPAAGAGPELPRVLASLLSQDYPPFELVFVTRDMEDPATPVIAEAIG